jgi:Kef-type K+ transport system membrane component KefB
MRFIEGWSWPEAQIAGIALSTTSVAVVYAVMVETGFNKTELGKVILAACFINDLGTVLALGIVFARFDAWLALFGAATGVALWVLPRFAPWFFRAVGHRVSEPEVKLICVVLLGLGGLAQFSGSEAVLPAYLVGMVLAPAFLDDPELSHRMRVIAFTILTPFYFLKAGSFVTFGTLVMYTTLLMSTGLTFGTISALFGLTNGIINQEQYTVLVIAVIGSAVVPTIIAQTWFMPQLTPIEESVRAREGPDV